MEVGFTTTVGTVYMKLNTGIVVTDKLFLLFEIQQTDVGLAF